jgi:hypothetical protein
MVADDSTLTDSTFAFLSDLAPNTTHWWRVRAYTAGGQYSNWSAVRTFRTALLPPGGLASADAGLTTRPTFDWGNVAGASNYAIQVSTVNTFATMLVNATTTPSQFTPAVDLPRNVLTYWRVRANGTNGPSLWTNGTSFVGANPPSVPLLVSPASGALVYDYTPTLDWGNSTPLPDHYQLQVSTNSGFSALVADDSTLTDSTFTFLSDLAPNTTHWWRVRAYTAGGQYSNWSAVRTFRTAILPPSLIAPADGAETSSRRPTFDWSDVAGATSYTLQVSTNNLFLTFVVNVNPVGSAYTMTVDLPLNKVLDWRVRANGPNGPSVWSPVWSFLVVP